MKMSRLLVLFMFLLLGGCGQWNDLVDTITGSDDDDDAATAVATVPSESQSSSTVPSANSEVPSANPTSSTTDPASTGTASTGSSSTSSTTTTQKTKKKEYGDYDSRTNGDRPTWRWSTRMEDFPDTFYVTVEGCVSDVKVSNNGKRFEGSGLIVKQSDVSGRGMAILASSSCMSTTCYVEYEE